MLLVNIGLGCTGLQGKNTPAYLSRPLLTKKKNVVLKLTFEIIDRPIVHRKFHFSLPLFNKKKFQKQSVDSKTLRDGDVVS